MIFLVVVIVGNQKKVFMLGMNFVGCTRRIDTGGGSKVFASLLSVSTTLLFFLFFPSFFVRGIPIFG